MSARRPLPSRASGPGCRAVLLAIASCAAAGLALQTQAVASAELPETLEQWTPGLKLLHSSHTEEALEWFLARKDARPHDVCGSYFPALVYSYFDVDGLSRDDESRRGLTLLEHGIAAGQKLLDRGRADDATRYCLGALYGLRAANRLERSKYVSAAFDARRARRVMLDLLERRPECIDCHFWIGSYDYFADVLPGMIKFFRSLFFFPKGDKQRGLDALREVGTSGILDRYNALWMLYRLNTDLEHDPPQALELLERIRLAYPTNVDARIALARHYSWVSVPPDRARSIALHLRAIEMIEETNGVSAEHHTLQVKGSLAGAYMSDLRPEAAVDVLLPLLPRTRGHEEREMRLAFPLVRAFNHAGRHAEAVRLLESLRARYPESSELEDLERSALAFDATSSRVFHRCIESWRTGREGDLARAQSQFRELLSSRQAVGVVHFGMAGMYLDLGRNEDAETHYRRAVEVGIERPVSFTPLAFVRLGNLLDLRGARGAAKGFYKKASSTAGPYESLRDVAKGYLKKPYDGTGGIRYP